MALDQCYGVINTLGHIWRLFQYWVIQKRARHLFNALTSQAGEPKMIGVFRHWQCRDSNPCHGNEKQTTCWTVNVKMTKMETYLPRRSKQQPGSKISCRATFQKRFTTTFFPRRKKRLTKFLRPNPFHSFV